MAEYQYVTQGMDDGAIIGAASTSLIAFYGATPVDQAAHVVDVTTTDQAVAAINTILGVLSDIGITAAS